VWRLGRGDPSTGLRTSSAIWGGTERLSHPPDCHALLCRARNDICTELRRRDTRFSVLIREGCVPPEVLSNYLKTGVRRW